MLSEKHMSAIERKLNICLEKLQELSNANGFRFSKKKKLSMHFCQSHKLHLDPSLYLDGEPVPVVKEHTFLGMIFDNKLNFIPHIQYLKAKCQKALNILKVALHYDWGAERWSFTQIIPSSGPVQIGAAAVVQRYRAGLLITGSLVRTHSGASFVINFASLSPESAWPSLA